MKTISIIICSYNRAGNLRKTLESLARVLPADDTHIEIVLVDNASTDETAKVMAEFAATRKNIKHLFEPVQGQTFALNLAAREATGEIIVWIDDDVVPRPGWLENLTSPIAEGQFDFVAGKIILAPHLVRQWMTTSHRERLAEVLPENGAGGLAGANMAASRKFLEKTQGYDPDLGAGRLEFQNDSLLVHQMEILGARIGYAENAVMEHHFDASRLKRESWLRDAERLGRSCAYVSYHWHHSTITFAWLLQWRKRAQLLIWRLRHRPNTDPESEGISIEELGYVQQIGYLDQYRIESRKPRCYVKQGLRKKL